MAYKPLLVNVQRLVWVGTNKADQDDLANWKVVEQWSLDYNVAEQRMHLGKTCQMAFQNGERIHTWRHLED